MAASRLKLKKAYVVRNAIFAGKKMKRSALGVFNLLLLSVLSQHPKISCLFQGGSAETEKV